MIEWFTPQQGGILGAIIGVSFGLWGVLIGGLSWLCIRKGLRKLYYSIYWTSFIAGIGLLIAGLIALFAKQPFHVWFVLLLPGFIMTLVPPAVFPVIRKCFTDQEMIQIQAKDL